MSDPTPLFWRTYTYACSDGCGWEKKVLLEVGLGGEAIDPRFWFSVDPEEVGKEEREALSGRKVLPVPFVAAGCPNCQGPEPPWDLTGATLKHVRWHEDEVLTEAVVDVPEDRPHFRYPDDPDGHAACGVFVIPGVVSMRGRQA